MTSRYAGGIGPPPSATHLFINVVVDKRLLSLLTPYKKMNFVTTYAEVLDGLRIYILEKKLFDPAIPVNINCCGDELSSVLGVEKFTVYEVRKLLQKFVFPVRIRQISADTTQAASASASNSSQQNSNEAAFTTPTSSATPNDASQKRKAEAAVTTPTSSVTPNDASQKRKAEDSIHLEGGALKKSCDQASTQSMYLYIPPSPTKDIASSDTAESIQGYETAFVADTSDESFPSSEESDSKDIITVEETFDVEYELASDSDEDTKICITESGSDSESGHNTVITFVCKTDDSDENFWADKSSDEEYESDLEILESDKWKCKRCNSLNNPLMRYCIKCWCMRSGWIAPKRSERRAPRKRKHKTKRIKKHEIPSSALCEEESSCSSKPCTSSSSSSAAESLGITISDNVDNFQRQPENTISDNVDNFQKQPENTDSLPYFPIISYEVDSSQECSNSSSNSSQESLSLGLRSNYFPKPTYSSSDVSSSSQELSTLSSYSSSQEFRSTSPYSSSSQEFSSSSYSTKSQRDVIKSLKHFSTLNLSNVPKCDSEAKLCLICCSKPANASIIHGKYAHQISCYRCARKLQYENKRCPVCRRTIDRVVHQISNIG